MMEKIRNESIFDMKWYVLNTQSGKEKKVKEAIERFLEDNELKDFFGQILISSHKTFVIKDGKRYVRERKIFPNYILIEMTMKPETYQLIMNIPGTSKFLGTGKNPKPLSESEVNKILGIKQDGEKVESEIRFIIGSRIRIIDGPFNDFEGSIEKIIEEKEKMVVSVSVFGRRTPVEVSFNQIETLD
ncbi:MAG: transcription termination/antitermination factor NusG [Candidatus Cloacimonetes bacterium]|nr:transcription termination/antitermination factor NusG [Candidatus Cloacimonadota bacterium]MBL7107844.1 transcription termination/antitermination factor NusG [Candidatus Cloacimonadota bacterium]